MTDLKEKLSAYARVDENVSMQKMTTLRIGGHARYTVYPETLTAFDGVMRILEREGISFKMIGKGSDLLCSDDDFDGAVIRFDRSLNRNYYNGCEVISEAGTSLIGLAVGAGQRGLSGLEFASGIPGTLGGAVFMNAGAYKSDISKVVEEVLVYKDHNFVWMKKEDCDFSYRHSIFQKHPDWIIVAARMHFTEEDPKVIEELMEDRRRRRLASQPLTDPSCGSVFKNPEEGNAWQYIDGIGYRGKQIGGALVSPKHCNFIVNAGNATAEDYMTLVREIQEKVLAKYGILLETEMEMFNWKTEEE